MNIKIRKNKYGCLGFASLLGFLGVYLGDSGYYSWFAFAVFFTYFFTIEDETFVDNMRKSASLAFFASLFAMVAITLVRGLFFEPETALLLGGIWAWTIGLGVFVFYSTYLEIRENIRSAAADKEESQC